ncbi:MAG: phosphoglucomutase/phosphomannomutase family protein [Erysipelothrix sp.]
MIKFGTGGWRAIIADEFTRENIRLLAQSLVSEVDDKKIVIGYDRRFLSDIAAQWLAEVFAGNGIKVYFINKEVPTPMIMFAIKKMGLNYGLAVTASHNPAIYNGVKIFTHGGRDATEDITQKLESNLENLGEVKAIDFDKAIDEGLIVYYMPQNEYIDSILAFVDPEIIRKSNLKVLVDTMHGVSKTSLSIILNTLRVDVDIINDRHDTLFGGKLPSPASSTLHKLSDMVKESNYDMGIATDGDADRIGIIDELGNFVHPNILISLIYYYLLEYKNWKGGAVRNLSTTHLIDKIAEDHGEICLETPVGFKHITSGMESIDALIGGESSGGLTIRGHINGKDGIFAATLLVEMISFTGKSIGNLVDELYDRYGKLYNQERDYRFSVEKKESIRELLFSNLELPKFNLEISTVSYLDGVKVVMNDGSWVSARFSGTEPLLRIFSEANSQKDSIQLVEAFESFLNIKPQ